MEEYSKTYQVKWSELDPNGHVRHSAYNDYGAQTRVNAFDDFGFGMDELIKIQIGPVLFREEVKFLREIRMNEFIKVDLQLLATRKDASKWSLIHHIYKSNGEMAAVVTVDGAWLDLKLRKIVVPPHELANAVMQYPKAETFQWIPDKKAK